MVPKCMTGYRSHECQWCISGICRHQFCLLEQRSTRESYSSHQWAIKRRPGLAFLCAQRSSESLSTLSTARLNLSLQQEEVFRLLGYATCRPWPSQWSCGHMPSEDAGACVDLSLIFCSSGKVNAAAATAVLPTPWTAVGQTAVTVIKDARRPSCCFSFLCWTFNLSLVCCHILQDPWDSPPPETSKWKKSKQCRAERGTWTSLCIT